MDALVIADIAEVTMAGSPVNVICAEYVAVEPFIALAVFALPVLSVGNASLHAIPAPESFSNSNKESEALAGIYAC